MTKRNKRFFREIKMALLRLFAYAIIAFLAVLAICLLVSIPEIIGMLIFG